MVSIKTRSLKSKLFWKLSNSMPQETCMTSLGACSTADHRFRDNARTIIAARVKLLPPQPLPPPRQLSCRLLSTACWRIWVRCNWLLKTLSGRLERLGTVVAEKHRSRHGHRRPLQSIESVEPTLSSSLFIDGLMKMALLSTKDALMAPPCAHAWGRPGASASHSRCRPAVGFGGEPTCGTALGGSGPGFPGLLEWSGTGRQFRPEPIRLSCIQDCSKPMSHTSACSAYQEAFSAPVCSVSSAIVMVACAAVRRTNLRPHVPGLRSHPASVACDSCGQFYRRQPGERLRAQHRPHLPRQPAKNCRSSDGCPLSPSPEPRVDRAPGHHRGEAVQSRQTLKTPDQLATDPSELEGLQWAYDNMSSGMSICRTPWAMRVALSTRTPGKLEIRPRRLPVWRRQVARVQQAAA